MVQAIAIIGVTPSTGDMWAADVNGATVATYSSLSKGCLDIDGEKIKCPKEIKAQLKDPNLVLVIIIAILIAALGFGSILYFNK